MFNLKFIRINIVLTAPVLAFSVAAQEHRVLEEVVVIAQKRTESVQDVPISISVVTAQNMDALNIQDFTEAAKLTPGVDLNPGLQSAAIRLRGVGPDFFALGAPQSVAVFVDQVAQAQVGAVFSTIVDVERLELLRGPQGTLYGQNAPGGVYNISTRRPSADHFEGYLEGSYSNFDDSDLATTDVRGALNIPLIQGRMAWRLAGIYADSDGYVTIEHPESADDTTGGKDHKAIRSRLLFNATDDLELLWTVNYQDLTDYRAVFNYDGLVPGTGGDNPVPAIMNEFEDRRYYGDFRSEVTADILDTSLHLSWDAGVTQVDFIGFYQEFDTQSDENRAPYFGGRSNFNIEVDYELTTLELRFSSTGDAFDYVAGLYYYDRPSSYDLDLLIGNAPVTGQGDDGNETYSAYANLNFHLADNWDLALGLRYDDNEISTESNSNLSGALESSLEDAESFDHLSWSAKLRWYMDEDTTAYIAVDNAFKQGGFNGLVAGAARFPNTFPIVAAVAEQELKYDEETSTAFEVGVKGTAVDGKLGYGVAIFYQEFDDHQVAHSAPNGSLPPFTDLFTGVITNADEVTTQGVEFDFTWLIGEHWTLSNRTAYFDAEAKEWNRRFCEDGEAPNPSIIYCPQSDADLNDLPQWNANTQLAYERLLSSGWNLYTNLSWTWQSEPNYTTNTDEFDEDKSRYDASIGMRSDERGLDFRLWGKNLTDEDLNINPNLRRNGDPNLPPAFQGKYFRGLEYGITAKYSF